MKLCLLSKLVIFFTIVATAADIYLIETSITGILMNILANLLFMILLVWITNWSCFTQSYQWIAWIIVVIAFIPALVIPFMIQDRNSPDVKQLVKEERELRKA